MSTNKETAEELKAENSYPSKKKKLCGNAFKISCAAGGFIAVVALCVLSSRFSWFGVQANENAISYDNGTVSSPISTTPALAESIPSETSRLVTSSQTADTPQKRPRPQQPLRPRKRQRPRPKQLRLQKRPRPLQILLRHRLQPLQLPRLLPRPNLHGQKKSAAVLCI